jgi:hypothetical protein
MATRTGTMSERNRTSRVTAPEDNLSEERLRALYTAAYLSLDPSEALNQLAGAMRLRWNKEAVGSPAPILGG